MVVEVEDSVTAVVQIVAIEHTASGMNLADVEPAGKTCAATELAVALQ